MFIDYLAVGAIGVSVGAGELIARYRDAPKQALTSYPGLLYLMTNALASILALLLIRTFDFDLQLDEVASVEAIRLAQVLVAGSAAIAIFRSSLFLVRVGNEDVGIGPSGFLYILLAASDRAVDRHRGQQRSQAVDKIMAGVSYAKAKTALPTYCLALMQSLSAEDQMVFGEQQAQLDGSDMDDRAKVLSLGLLIMDFMGEDVLAAAVRSLKPVIMESEAPPS